RLIMACFTMGEAAGTATAMSLAKGIAPRKLDRIELQRELIANGVNIGQQMRDIPGVTEKQELTSDKYYLSGEFHAEKVVIKDRQDQFNSQGKSDKAAFDVK
ncbi:MAG: FAD-dependent oxidoreductase, partial [Clostridia bacterium]|nr:FAD-dependent oxidoreductase [Clostridia bacterium]